VCGPLDPVYVNTATETGGQPYPLSTSEVAQSARIMSGSSLHETILWASGSVDHSYAIPIDPTVGRMMVSGTFDATGGSLTLIGPDGTEIRQADRVDDTPLNCGRIITVDAPASGNWHVRIAPSARFWLRVLAKSDVSLLRAEFVERRDSPDADNPVRIQGQPIAGRPAMLRVRLSSSIQNPTFQLVSLDASTLQTIELQSRNAEEFVGTTNLPAEPFRVVATGRDESGGIVQRVWAGLFHAEAIEVVPPPGELTVTAGAEIPVTFTVRNHGSGIRVWLVASDGRGKVVAVDPPTLDLAEGGEGTVSVRWTVPRDVLEGETTIRLTASRDAPVGIGGYNSAAKTFTVTKR
jgi:hypothetical protein